MAAGSPTVDSNTHKRNIQHDLEAAGATSPSPHPSRRGSALGGAPREKWGGGCQKEAEELGKFEGDPQSRQAGAETA